MHMSNERLLAIVGEEMDVLSMEECNAVAKKLEKFELDSSGGVENGQNSCKLLALYLLQNDLCSAKYLWKRTPQSVKQSTPEIVNVWNVGQKMWLRDFYGIHTALNQEWSENVATIMNSLKEAVRNRAVNLVARAYSSIRIDEFAAMVGLNTQQSLQLVLQHNWNFNQESGMVLPSRAAIYLPDAGRRSEQQLAKLTEFVSFLEN
ncbi:hypothetical protein CHUAL_004220 [Chamberlinius hualienensis]